MGNRPAVREFFADKDEHLRQLAKLGNDLLVGRSNAYKDVTLDPSATQTDVVWAGLTQASCVVASALTANAAATMASAGLWYEPGVPNPGELRIHHESTTDVDKTFRMIAFT